MNENLLIGVVSLGIAAGLLFLGWPDKNGESPRFLQFEASLVLYPSIIMVFLAAGFAELITGLLRMPH
ncbi:MAG TPA: hypothetical protein VNR65_06800 [Geobacterales bacterium]|nr:hypothetical protein [Geobacterales bacterium]